MHAKIIARQGHHIAKRRDARQQPVRVCRDPAHAMAKLGGQNLGLADAQHIRQIAFAHFGFVGAGGRNRRYAVGR